MARRWYVVRTLPQAEYQAADELGRTQFEVFFPRTKTVDKRAGHIDAPLFPGYLFLRFDLEEDGWPMFRPGHRVRGLLRFGGEVPWLQDKAVEELANTVEEINQGRGLWRRFRIGERVWVVSGELESLAEIVDEAKSPEARAKVLLEFMGRLVPAHVPWKDLRPIEDETLGKHQAHRRTRGRGRWIRGFESRAPVTT